MNLNLLISIPALLLAITIHELSHGYISYILGDPTAKNEGRLTLNPIKHIDPIGALGLLFFHFGWAKPVPINPFYYKNRKLGIILVSIAGPMSNFILAFLTTLALKISISGSGFLFSNQIAYEFISMFLIYNVSLGIFNLIPLPPLDGSKILASLLPEKYEFFAYKNEKYFMIALFALMYFGVISKIMNPIVSQIFNFINIVLNM